MYLWLFLAFTALTALFYFLTGNTSAFSGLSNFERWASASALSIMTLYATIMLMGLGESIGRTIRYVMIWIGIGFALVAGYSFRDELKMVTNRVAGELVPAGQGITISNDESKGHSVRIRRGLSNHFQAQGSINGFATTMLVDTGASTIVLKPSDAKSAGIDTASLSYTYPVNTANGQAFAARVTLREVSIGPISFRNVEAMVAQPGALNENLLGMSFLTRLRSYEFSKDFLTLRS